MRIPVIGLLVLTFVCVLITGFWDTISTTVFPNTSWGLYSREFFENVLVEAHGAVIDLLFVGVVLYWFERRRDYHESVAQLQEDLTDLRLYRAPDAPYRTLGTIRRLLNLKVNALHLSELNLDHVEVRDLHLVDCELHATKFIDSKLHNVRFDRCKCDAAIFAGASLEHVHMTDCSLRRAKFQNATLKGMDFRSCQLQVADFTNANLRSADFRGVDCKGISFRDADLRSANFIGATNLDAGALAAARNIKSLKSNDPQIQALVATAP
jgi:uncharacterized protein YjbI with pentapeptide repeats